MSSIEYILRSAATNLSDYDRTLCVLMTYEFMYGTSLFDDFEKV